jgi:hypothetical protein
MDLDSRTWFGDFEPNFPGEVAERRVIKRREIQHLEWTMITPAFVEAPKPQKHKQVETFSGPEIWLLFALGAVVTQRPWRAKNTAPRIMNRGVWASRGFSTKPIAGSR